jgi:AcrR family transcriptional regulator
MSRPVDEKRPEALREAIVEYLIAHGLADLSLRPLAKAVGSSPRVLLYYFGSKEGLIIQVLADVRQRQRASYGQAAGNLTEACRFIWKRMRAPGSEPLFRLFFEAYGLALRYPKLYKSFLQATIDDWLELIAGSLHDGGHGQAQARARATVVLAGLRGFMLDYCTTHDRKRLDAAVDLWLRGLDCLMSNDNEVRE